MTIMNRKEAKESSLLIAVVSDKAKVLEQEVGKGLKGLMG